MRQWCMGMGCPFPLAAASEKGAMPLPRQFFDILASKSSVLVHFESHFNVQ